MVDLISPWLTPAEVAAYLHVTPRTLRRWALTGTGPPYYKIRATVVRYHQDELDQWVQTTRRRHTADDGTAPPQGEHQAPVVMRLPVGRRPTIGR